MKNQMPIVIVLIVLIVAAYFILNKKNPSDNKTTTMTRESKTGLSTLFNSAGMGALLTAVVNKGKDDE